MTKQYNIAIVGATGAVGETFLTILAERNFPVEDLYPLASERSAGDTVRFKNKNLLVENLADFDFSKADIAFFSAGAEVSKQYAPLAAQTGCLVIDNTSAFRYDDAIPLVVPEVNPQALEHFREHNIISNPNCSTAQMLLALKPIHDAVGVTRVNVATYQSVSGTGKDAIEELVRQTASLLNGRPVEKKVYSQQIAFNVLPYIDDIQENGYTKEEMKMLWETQKILQDKTIGVNATAVRVPVFYGHSVALHIETKHKLTAAQAKKILSKAPGVEVVDNMAKLEFPTPVVHASGKDPVYIGRIREDISYENGLSMWVVADNIRKGAALNSIQIVEYLIAQGKL